MRLHRRFDLALLLTTVGASACGMGAASAPTKGGFSDGGFGSSTGGSFGGNIPGTGGSSNRAGGGGADPLPPEQEVESSFEVPVATGRFVWIANPLSGRVAFVDASTLKIRTVEAGNAPTYLAPIPDA